MGYITREQYDAAIGGYSFLNKIAKQLAEDYRDEFVGGKYASIENVDVVGDEIAGDVEMEFDVSYCGCCPGEIEIYEVPADYLWRDDWKEVEREKRREQIRIIEEQKRKEEEERKAERERLEYERYLKLKEKYE